MELLARKYINMIMEISAMELWMQHYQNPFLLPHADAHRMTDSETLLRSGCSTLFSHLRCQFIVLPDTINSAAPAESFYPVWLQRFDSKIPSIYKRLFLKGTYFIQLSLHLWVKEEVKVKLYSWVLIRSVQSTRKKNNSKDTRGGGA